MSLLCTSQCVEWINIRKESEWDREVRSSSSKYKEVSHQAAKVLLLCISIVQIISFPLPVFQLINYCNLYNQFGQENDHQDAALVLL